MKTYIKGTMFKDEFFPAAQSSLFWDKFVKDQNDAMQAFKKKVTKWARPTDMYPHKAPSLWGDKGLK